MGCYIAGLCICHRGVAAGCQWRSLSRCGASLLSLPLASMQLLILRVVFVLVAIGIATLLVEHALSTRRSGLAALARLPRHAGPRRACVIALDIFMPRKPIDVISAVYFGLLVGVVLDLRRDAGPHAAAADHRYVEPRRRWRSARRSSSLLGMVLCYICISLLMQTKDDFRFIIPYVEFSKEVKGLKPYVLDTSVVIDGRIADLVETSVLDNQLIMPRFVLAELQAIADSSDKLRRARGRRGLDILNRLRNNENVDLKIYDRELPEMDGQPVDMKLVLLAKHLEGKIVTGDYNLNKVARLHNVAVINLNDIANSLKPVFLPGEIADRADRQARRRDRPGRRLPRRRHDDRRRRRPRPHRQGSEDQRHQRPANLRRPDDLWEVCGSVAFTSLPGTPPGSAGNGPVPGHTPPVPRLVRLARSAARGSSRAGRSRRGTTGRCLRRPGSAARRRAR